MGFLATLDNPDEVFCQNTLGLPVGLRAHIFSLETERTYMCMCGWKTTQTVFVLWGVNVLKANVQVWKLGRFPRSQSTDTATESQGLAPQFSGFHALIVQKGLKTGLKVFVVVCLFIKAIFKEEGEMWLLT